ncbi:MAG: PEF-CTERM sorting domain-containing protein [Methanosarcinaceae archaeon]|nr:PEF-CTERM sorting domain-containing protein [Methanosarcinaceae archaeon]
MAYTIDGDLSDWGVNLRSGLDETDINAWQPTKNTVDWIIEDNIDPAYTSDLAYPDWTGYSDTGTHIKKDGDLYTTYYEPTLAYDDWWSRVRDYHYLQPAGGEYYDIEALYFDDDAQYAYIAIVTSMPPDGHIDGYGRFVAAGDIAIDLDANVNTGEYGYEYGIKTHGSDKGMIRYNPDWSLPQATDGFIVNAPSEFNTNSGTLNGTAELVYVNANADETVNYGSDSYLPNGIISVPNYIIEAKIPKSAIGNPTVGQTSNIHVSIGCGNDVIELTPVTFETEIPEFPTVALPVCAILGLFYVFGSRRRD